MTADSRQLNSEKGRFYTVSDNGCTSKYADCLLNTIRIVCSARFLTEDRPCATRRQHNRISSTNTSARKAGLTMLALAPFLIGIVVGVAVAMMCLHAVLAVADQRAAVQLKARLLAPRG